ncbi:TetR/AcrR family transcriptional regulator [Paenibacillus taiwanensis]|uniref:TetR/AcrR family transcriptional regulator n=1 Tax=Paenibacillus taiwanensis TaxID=401638 RepID=UPI0003FE85A2|nr:TetR/AcrR family transcriptional regulator [Paenibacillus taiwanensis]
MARNEEKDRELRKERCEQIMSAAVELFAKNGINSTKISDIAKQAGMSHGLVYNYFKSKEEIYVSLLNKNINSFKHELVRITQMQATADVKLQCLVEQVYVCKWEDVLFHQSFVDQFMTSDSTSAELKDAVKQQMKENLQLVTSIMADGQATGHIVDGSPSVLAYYFLSCLQSILLAEAKDLSFIEQDSAMHVLHLFVRHQQ